MICDFRLPIADLQIENGSSLPPLRSFEGQTRAFLKVQDGCDGYCTYCIVPKTRPVLSSKPVARALAEAQALVNAGHREIVVTGIFLGAYSLRTVRRKNWPAAQNDNLAHLLDKMANLPNMERIRLSSLEPADVTPRLLDTLSKHRNIMPHLHLPLQSGSDTVLRRMCRQYRVAHFKDTVKLLKSRLDRPAITTDIIVGFPGETEADFEQTVDLAREVGFAKMHIFSFSPRKGTAAEEMEEAVDHRVMKKRSEFMHNLSIELGLEYRNQFTGETAQVLLETDSGQFSGRSERYFTVVLKDPDENLKKNQVVSVKLIENHQGQMVGTAL